MVLADAVEGRRFDTVLAEEIIEHLEEPHAILRQVRTVLRPGARLVLSTPNPLGFPVVLLELLRNRSWFYTRDHTFYFLPRWVEPMLGLSGYRLEASRPGGLWLPFGHVPWSPTILSYHLIYIARPLRNVA